MRHTSYIFLSILGLSLSTISCSLGRKDSSKDSGVVVHVIWENMCRSQAKTLGAPEAWCLLSDSSFEDGGQILVYLNADKKSATVDRVEKGKVRQLKEFQGYKDLIATSHTIKGDAWKKFHEQLIGAEKLEDIDTKTLDGVTFTFVHFVKNEKADMEKTKIIFMNNPEQDKVKAAKHLELIAAFQKAAK